MRIARIAPVVEGDGEVLAVPVLLRRVLQSIDGTIQPRISRPFRHPSGSLRRSGGLERAIQTVAEIHPGHSILVLIDSDDDCPKELGAELIVRANLARPDLVVSIVLAKREYEAWFLAAGESIAGVRNLPPNLRAPDRPEEIRDAKGWLSNQMPGSFRYSPTQDQASLTDRFDLQLARMRSRSFQKLWREMERILLRTCA